MGAHIPEMEAMESATAEALLSSLKTIEAAERRRHATVMNYWLSIRGDRAFPPIRDLDPIEISDAGPNSILLEMVGGGEDADIRHIGSAIKPSYKVDKIGDAPARSLLCAIASKLPIVAATKDAFAFEEDYEGDDGSGRCWVTLLPFSAGGTLIDFVYGFVSLEGPQGSGEETPEAEAPAEKQPQAEAEAIETAVEEAAQIEDEAEPDAIEAALDEMPEVEEAEAEVIAEPQSAIVEEEEELVLEEPVEETELLLGQAEAEDVHESSTKPGFSGRFSEKLKSVAGFYGRVADLDMGPWKVETNGAGEPAEPEAEVAEEPEAVEPVEEIEAIEPPDETEVVEDVIEEEEAAEEDALVLGAEDEIQPADEIGAEEAAERPAEQSFSTGEGTLQTKLAEVRAKADEARQAKLRANAALYEGLGAAYDFALDAESAPEEYLKLVEGQGLKIQLRSPMKPVVKLAFDGLCDDATIGQLETVLAWALKQDLPRGSLAEHIQAEGGIAAILGKSNGKAN